MTGEDIVRVAREYIGVPFRHWGRNPYGVDCVGLVLAVAYELGISEYVPRPYSRQINSEEMREQLELCCNSVPFSEKKPGDILFFRVRGYPQHLGIYTGETFIHAFEVVGKVCEVRWSASWEERLEAVYRWKGLE